MSTAHAPVTWGGAIDVPTKLEKPPPGTEEFINSPGASRFRKDALFEKLETKSANPLPDPSVVDPTLIAVEIQAGEFILSVYPLLPEAITVAIPSERRLSIVDFIAVCVESQLEKYRPPPKLKFTAAMFSVLLNAWTRCRPRI